MMQDTLDTLLRQVDGTAAQLWRQLCQDLSGPLRIGLISHDPRLVEHLLSRLPRQSTQWVPLHHHPEQDALGLQERLLSLHGLVWVTSAMTPLTATERTAMEQLGTLGAPQMRRLTLENTELLNQMSDDPTSELAEITHRASQLSEWPLQSPVDLSDTLNRSPETRHSRRLEVGEFILHDLLIRLDAQRAPCVDAVQRLNAQLAEEESQHSLDLSKAKQAIQTVLIICKKHTESLLIDLREELDGLQQDLAQELDSVPLDVGKQVVTHWLHHRIHSWLEQRLLLWQHGVHQELTELAYTEEDLASAALLLPALSIRPIHADQEWSHRIGATVALGGSALLLAMGLWLPALFALGGGLGLGAWSSFGNDSASASQLHDAASRALRDAGEQAADVLSEQLQQIGLELDRLHALNIESLTETFETTRAERTRSRDLLLSRIAEQDAVRSRLEAWKPT